MPAVSPAVPRARPTCKCAPNARRSWIACTSVWRGCGPCPRSVPPRDRFAAVAARVRHDRRQLYFRRTGIGALALAASLLLAVVGRDLMAPPAANASDQLTTVMAESATLEQALRQIRSSQQVTDAYTTRAAASLEDRIAELDHELESAQMQTSPATRSELLPLWRERVGLMDALVDVHLTRAHNVGL